MFGVLKNKNLVTALDDCQKALKKQGLGMELSNRYYASIIRAPIFVDINSRFTNQGLSNYGGLSWCLAQMLERGIFALKSGDRRVCGTFMDYNEKLAQIALLIGNSTPQLKLTSNDLVVINRSAKAVLGWNELTFIEDKILTA